MIRAIAEPGDVVTRIIVKNGDWAKACAELKVSLDARDAEFDAQVAAALGLPPAAPKEAKDAKDAKDAARALGLSQSAEAKAAAREAELPKSGRSILARVRSRY
jgi:hypothetical protein